MPLRLAQHEDLTIIDREVLEGAAQGIHVGLADVRRFRVESASDQIMALLARIAEQERAAVPLQPPPTRVSDDSEKPCPGIAARLQTIKRFDSPEAGLLHDILGILRVAAHPASEVEGGVQ